MRLEISGRSIVGSKEPQQDSWRIFGGRGENLSDRAKSSTVATGDGTLVIVADGIGGYAGGEVASRAACEAFAGAFFSREGAVADRLAMGLDAANMAIAAEKQRSPDLHEMGCTLIAVHFADDRMTFVSVGDSLLLRSRDDEIHRVNLDHSYFDYLDRKVLGSGDANRWSIAMGDKRRGSLTLAVTGTDLNAAEFGHRPQIATRPLLADDIIIVASDGIETLDLVQLQNFLRHLRSKGVADIADSLIGSVDGIGKTRSYQDNTTIVVVGATGGAGLTRVSTGPHAAAAVPSASLLGARPSLLSRFFFPSKAQLLTASAVFAVLLLAILFLFAGKITDDSDFSREQGQPSAVGGKALSPQVVSRDSSRASGPRDTSVEQGGGQQATISSSSSRSDPNAITSITPPDTKAPLESAPALGASRAERDTLPPVGQEPTKFSLKPNLKNIGWLGPLLNKLDGTSDSDCFRACLENDACLAFTSRGGYCALFHSITGQEYSSGAQSGVKEWNNFAWQGGKPIGTSLADNSLTCFRTCLKTQDCVAYTWRLDKRCELWSQAGQRVQEMSAYSGARYITANDGN